MAPALLHCPDKRSRLPHDRLQFLTAAFSLRASARTKSPIAGAFPVRPPPLRCDQEKGEKTMNDGPPILPARNVELGASGEEFQNLHEFVRKARARLNQN